MISFNSTITNLDAFNTSLLWQTVEHYCHIGQTAYRVVKIEGKAIDLEPTDSTSNFFITLGKILSYVTLILPLIALCVREWYRRSYQFEIMPKQLDKVDSEQEELEGLEELNERPLVETAYKIEDVIAQLKQAQAEGFKLGLFVGRRHDQTIPQEKGWVWCSLDIVEFTSPLGKRLHLRMDCNNQEEMQKIQGLFDKVVCDFSVIKFFDTPWETLKRPLVNKPDAELIVEGWKGCSTIKDIPQPIYKPAEATMINPIKDELNYYRDEERAFNQWKQNIGEDAADQNYQEFLANMPEDKKRAILRMNSGSDRGLKLEFMRDILKKNNLEPKKINHIPTLLATIKVYLLKYFQEVTLMHGAYPYLEKEEEIITDYWIARHPIN